MVFGAIGGLIGGALIAARPTPPDTGPRYYKATAIMRLDQPVVTTGSVDPIVWSLQLAQLAIASQPFRATVAAESGSTVDQIQDQLFAIAFPDTATLQITATTTDSAQAVRIARSAAANLNDAITQGFDARNGTGSETPRTDEQQVDTLIAALRTQLGQATGAQKAQIAEKLSAAEARAATLATAPSGSTLAPPVFASSSEPEAIRINAAAYFARWLMASDDLGIPRIQVNPSLANVNSIDSTGRQNIARALQQETTLPASHKTPPIRSLSLGLLAGLVMGLSGVVLGEAWDERVNGSIQAARLTGMDVLVEIPRLSRRRVRAMSAPGAPTADTKVADARTRYGEAASMLAQSLGLEPRGPVDEADAPAPSALAPIVVVTSTARSEGRTTSVVALAAAFADLGLKVLAVEGDHRRRSLRKLLRPIPNFVSPDTPSETAVERVWHLDVSTTADRDIASSSTVSRVLRHVRSARVDFDVVVIDTPAVLATADAIEYLEHADATLLIVRLEQTMTSACRHTATTLLDHTAVTPRLIVTDVPAGAIDRYEEAGG